MPAFSSGKYAQAVCAHCTFAAPYLELILEDGTGHLVHPDCADELRPERVARTDAVALRHPRPDRYVEVDTDEDEDDA